MLEKGDKVILPNGQWGSIQGWAIEQSIKNYPQQKPYKKTSRKQALASNAPMVEVWNMSKHSSEPTEFYLLSDIRLPGQK